MLQDVSHQPEATTDQPAFIVEQERFEISGLVIDQVVEAVRVIQRTARVTATLDVGALIVEKLFGGDLERVHARGSKDVSFRRLAAHPRLPCSASTLWRCVRVYELVRRMPWLVNLDYITVTHIVVVLALPAESQETLLRQAGAERWTVAQLRKKVKAERGGSEPEKKVATPLARSVRHLHRLRRRLDLLVGGPGAIDTEDAPGLLDAVLQTRAWCDAMAARLTADATAASN